MTPTDLTADLPPPRNDEPGGLRSDIVDELGDHLACAVHREQVLGAARGETTPETVWPRVVERFGNPRAVARRLWFDAMWERLMNQRITTVMLGLVAVIALAGVLLCWQTLLTSRELAAHAQAANVRSEAAIAALMKELQELRSAPAPVPAST